MNETDLHERTRAAIARRGAAIVYGAALRAMNGQHADLDRVGLSCAFGNLPALMVVSDLAYAAMTPDEQAADLADAAVKAAQL